MTRQYPYRAVLKTENVINSIVIVRDRDIRFRTIAITISAPPKMACSFHGSGNMMSGQSATHAANASIPSTNDAKDAVGLDCESDPLIAGHLNRTPGNARSGLSALPAGEGLALACGASAG